MLCSRQLNCEFSDSGIPEPERIRPSGIPSDLTRGDDGGEWNSSMMNLPRREVYGGEWLHLNTVSAVTGACVCRRCLKLN